MNAGREEARGRYRTIIGGDPDSMSEPRSRDQVTLEAMSRPVYYGRGIAPRAEV
jgi:hypothetical protein